MSSRTIGLLKNFTGNADCKGKWFPPASAVGHVKGGQPAGFVVQLHMPVTIPGINFYIYILARERLGSTSSITGRGYLSLFSALFSCGCRQSHKSPDSFVAITRLFTQSVGSKSRCCIPSNVPRSPSKTSLYSSMISSAVCA